MIKKFFQHNKLLIFLIMLFVYIFGFFAFLKIPKESTPSLDIPYYVINIVSPGNDAKTIYLQYIQKVENKIATVKNITSYKSLSADDVGIVTVEFKRGTSRAIAYSDLKLAVDEASASFSDNTKIFIKSVDIVDLPVLIFSVIGDKDIKYLYNKIRFLKDDLEKISGVSRVEVIGGYTPQIEIKLDYNKLSSLKIPYQSILGALSLASVKFGADLKIVDNQLYSVVISTYPDNLSGNLINKLQILKENIQQIPVFYSSGSVVRIKDIAQVKVDAPFFKKLSYVDGLPAVTYKIYKNPGIDMPLLVEKIKGYLTSKHKYFEENNLKLVYTYSRLDDIRRVFNTFLENFWQTSLIILGVLFLFLGFRYAFGVFLAFPLVYLIVFIYFLWKGFTFNNIVSFSLILTLGIMVDNLIVIVDGIKEYFNKFGGSILEAIEYSIKNYWKPLLAGNLTSIVMFIPIGLALSGRVGEFIKYLPITVDVTLIVSMFVAIVFLPVIFLIFPFGLKKHEKVDNLEEGKLYQFVVKLSQFILDNSKKIVIAFWILFVVSLAMFVKFGTIDFLPLTDKNNIYVNIRYNKDVNLQQNRELTNKIYNFVKNFFKDKYPNIVENIQVQIGTKTVFQPLQNFFFFNSFNPELATLNIKLIDSQLRDDKNNAVYIYQTLNKSLQNCIQQNTGLSSNIKEIYAFIQKNSPSAGKDISFALTLSGFDIDQDPDKQLEVLLKVYNKILPNLKTIKGTYGWGADLLFDNGKINVIYDIDKLIKYHLNIADINRFIFSILQNEKIYKGYGVKVGVFDDLDKNSINVVSYTSLSGRDWKNIKIPGTDIYLGQIIKDIKLLPKIKYYSNEDGRLVLKIDAFKYPNISLGYVTKKIKAIVEKYPQVQLYYSADIKDMQSAMKGLVVALLIGLIMMFLVLVGNFGNLKYSVIAFSILPLLLIGTFWFLLVFDLPFSFPAQLGIFGLIGVGINNAILLLERYLQLKNSGLNKKQIIIHTIFSRLRPVFLTTLTTVLGLISLALKDELWGSLGVAFMGGLIFGTLITLVYIPAWLSILKD